MQERSRAARSPRFAPCGRRSSRHEVALSARSGRTHFPDGALDHLRRADPVLRELIDRVGPFQPAHEPDVWRSLVEAIVGQQLSLKAAASIAARVAALAGASDFPDAAELLAAPAERLRACGLSGAKVRSVHDLAAKWLDGTLAPEDWPRLEDEEIVAELTRVRGIGRWTAEMVLIFTLRRPDVLPVDDLGFRSAVQRAYALDAKPSAAELRALAEPWRPYRSAATLYLWRSLRL